MTGTRFAFDPAQSQVAIEARSSLHPIRARTAGLEGWFEAELLGGGRVNLAVPPMAELELPIELLSSGNPLYDREMRRRVDARKFPTITGELTVMKQAEGDQRYLIGGDVTFRGVTRSYEDEMSVVPVDDRTIRLVGSHTFDIRDFGMEPPRILTLRVYPDVEVSVEIVARRDA